MEQPKPTFSESWYRVAGQRIDLRPAIHIHRQFYRGERWYVVQNRFNNEFFRLAPAAYEFLVRLEGRTVEEAWQQCLEASPEEAPTQDEVIQLLAQLYHANLLRSALPANTTELFKRHTKRRERQQRARWLNLLSIQIPLWDPDAFLKKTLPWLRPLFGKLGLLLWLLVVGGGIKVAVDHWSTLRQGADGVLAPGNLPLLYLAMIGIKAFHEFGHGFACRYFGGEVHRMGVMLLLFSPVPYVDATSSWAFRSRWHRILVAAAGMIVELFIAAIAVFIWANTAPGVVHSLAYNAIFIASVTTLLFNANPLLRYDGYYILSDLLEMPNLSMRSNAYLEHLAERWLFGLRQSNPAKTQREGWILALYGVASWIYRIVLSVGIVLFLAQHYLLLGVIMAILCLASVTVVPLVKLVKYLWTSPRLATARPRAIAVTCAVAGIALILLGTVPMPNHFRAPGVAQAERYSDLFTAAPGYLAAIKVHSGQTVRKGEPLLELRNRELELELQAAEAEARVARVGFERAVEGRSEEMRPWQDRLVAAERLATHLRDQISQFTLRAPHDGVWSGAEIEKLAGTWLPRGTPAGTVVDESRFEFTAVVPQTDAASLFGRAIMSAEVRLMPRRDQTLSVTAQRILPANQAHLPSAALGWLSGGEVAVAASDPHGRKTVEPFFEVRASLAPTPGGFVRHGCSGKIRFTLQPEPLLSQWERKLRQLFQRHLQS